ncbi:MAG: DDE-type integrase/transposase/recombinase, partial [Thermoplasmata archaeon]
ERECVMRARARHPASGAFTLEKAIEGEEGLHIPHNRIHRILKENGLAKDEPRKQRRRKWVRYERKHSNSLWHADWVEIGGAYVILIEDDASRLLVGAGSYKNATAQNSLRALKKAVAAYGKPRQLMTDHGIQFTSLPRESCPEPGLNGFQKWLEESGIEHVKARVKHPQSNGKMEKAAGTMMRLIQHFGGLERAVSYYNYRRPHWSLRLEECETPFQAFIRKMWPAKRRAFIRENIKMIARYAPAYLLEGGFTVERGPGT